jgi:hypothetical protein
MFPYEPNFNPPEQKPAISVCGPRQLIVGVANTLLPAKTVPVWYSYVQYYDRPTEYTE